MNTLLIQAGKKALEMLEQEKFPQNDWATLSPENTEIREFVHYSLFNHKPLAEELCEKHKVIRDNKIHHGLTQYMPSSFNGVKKQDKINRLACEKEFYNRVIKLLSQ